MRLTDAIGIVRLCLCGTSSSSSRHGAIEAQYMTGSSKRYDVSGFGSVFPTTTMGL